MEPTPDNSALAVIQTKMERVQLDIQDIKQILRDGYATKDSLVSVAKDTEARLTKLEGASNFWRWLAPILAAIMGSVFTFLIIQYITNIK